MPYRILFLANSIPTYRQAIRDQENARANQAAIASAIRYDALQGVNDPEQQGLYQQQPQQYQQYNQQGGYAQQEFYYQQQQQGTTEEQKNLQGYDHPPVPMYAQNTAYNPYGQQK